MPLSRVDVARISAAGHRSADFAQGHGNRRTLRNVEGHCVFLSDGLCTVYPIRPEGCRLYPLVYDEALGRPTLDACCPYREEFKVDEGDREALRLLVKSLR
jgi:Fe-S-cluster containining protein